MIKSQSSFAGLSRSFRNTALLIMLIACTKNDPEPGNSSAGEFVSFKTNGQTLPTAINAAGQAIRLEVDHDVDISQLVPTFEIPKGYKAYIHGTEQVSGNSTVDFSTPVSYEVRSANNVSTTWEVTAVPLGCRILVDASKDGGGWWYPQSPKTGFDPDQWHQGKPFADLLRAKGFEVKELARGVELTEETFFGYYIVIRATGFFPYTSHEIDVYENLLERGLNLVLFSDHMKHDLEDELAEHVGLKLEGLARGKVVAFTQHEITENISSIDYIAGSVLTNLAENPNIEVLGWLRDTDYADLNFNEVKDEGEQTAPPVMGVLPYSNSRVFFIGDVNGLQIQPQPFIDNLITWMGVCFQP